MKPQYTCPECGTGFSDQTAYCENWRDKERKFGCPNCKTFFSIGLSEIENKQKPILAALIFTAILALAMYAIDVSLWGYVFVLVVGHQSYYLAAKFFEGNPKTVLTPITGPKNA